MNSENQNDSTQRSADKPVLDPEGNLRGNVTIALGIAVCGVIIVAFPYYANYGSTWSGRFFFFGYAVIFIGFLLSAIVSAAASIGRGFLLTGGAVLFLMIGLDSWVASLGRNSTSGTSVELVMLLLALFAIMLFALGLGQSAKPEELGAREVDSPTDMSNQEASTRTKHGEPLERGTTIAIAVLAFLTAVIQSTIALFGS